MIKFETVIGDIKVLKVPFANAYTAVTLIDDEFEKILVDSGALETDVDNYIVPALKELGYTLSDIKYLMNTHSHGDHVGGYSRIKELNPSIKVVASVSDYKNVENPAALAIKTRSEFKGNSPTPQSYLKGVKVDKVLDDDEMLNDRISLIMTPGHDNGCVCIFDHKTKTILTGDSLQGNGTGTQGIAFYKSLNLYRYSLLKLMTYDIENIICGHDYDKIGSDILGYDNVSKTLKYCLDRTFFYQDYIDECLKNGMTDQVEIAKKMINEIGCGMPSYLFMALYTVREHVYLSRIK